MESWGFEKMAEKKLLFSKNSKREAFFFVFFQKVGPDFEKPPLSGPVFFENFEKRPCFGLIFSNQVLDRPLVSHLTIDRP